MGQPIEDGEEGGEGERKTGREQHSKQKGCWEEDTVMSAHVLPGLGVTEEVASSKVRLGALAV